MDNTSAVTESSITGDEKLLALFSHLSLFLGGIILPLIFWLTNKDKSKFVTFHSLQALWFHLAYAAVIVIFVFVMVIGMLIAGVGLGSMTGGGKEMSPFFIIIMIAFYGILMLIIFGVIGYSIYMAIKSYKGEYVKYPVIGNMVYKRVYGTA
jgi:uncharacterized Tic20 family protein